MDQETKAKRIFDEVQNELKDSFAPLSEMGKNFKVKYENVIQKLDGYFRKHCNEQINWLESNTENTQNGPVLKDKSKSNEMQKVVNDLQQCIQKYDVGSQQVFSDFQQGMNSLEEKFHSQMNDCIKLKGENEMRNCFKSLVQGNLKELTNIYDVYNKHFDQMDSKL